MPLVPQELSLGPSWIELPMGSALPDTSLLMLAWTGTLSQGEASPGVKLTWGELPRQDGVTGVCPRSCKQVCLIEQIPVRVSLWPALRVCSADPSVCSKCADSVPVGPARGYHVSAA